MLCWHFSLTFETLMIRSYTGPKAGPEAPGAACLSLPASTTRDVVQHLPTPLKKTVLSKHPPYSLERVYREIHIFTLVQLISLTG